MIIYCHIAFACNEYILEISNFISAWIAIVKKMSLNSSVCVRTRVNVHMCGCALEQEVIICNMPNCYK